MDKDEIDKNDEQEIKHTDFIMDILPIVSHNRLATASLDKNICLWDLRKLKPLKLLKDHQAGVYCLEWNEEMNILISCGLDHDIYVWNPICDKKIFMLKGHNHSLVGVKCLKGTN